MKIFDNNSLSIGNTPLVRLRNMARGLKADVLAKIEGRNPSYSVKCRLGAALIADAEKMGILQPGMEVVESTSGNTGIALASVCAARGYPLTLTMPDTMSIERRRILKVFGAKLVLTPGAEGMAGAVRRAEEIAASSPGKYYLPQQFKNPSNPAIHEATTGPEIWADTDGAINYLVAGIGTGGTITGVSRFIKSRKPIISVGVEPAESPVISQHLAGEPLKPGSHKIQGIGAGFIPPVLDLLLVDRVERVTSDEAMSAARRLALKEGILSGISCGAAVAAALRIAQEDAAAGKTIVVILPDSGERYLSSPLFADIAA